MPNLLLLRATPAHDTGAEEIALAPFDAARAHDVLCARQRHDLAAWLEHGLTPEESAALAAALYRYVDSETRARFFRSYRRLLPDDEAQALVYLAGWLWRAAQARVQITAAHAVRVPAARPADAAVSASQDLERSLPLPARTPSQDEQRTSARDGVEGIMPPWLDAPGHSVWSDGPPALPGL